MTAVFLAVTMDMPAISSGDTDARTAATTRRFYAALNEAVRTGDLSLLDSVFAPETLATEPIVAGDHCDLRCRVSALHKLAPHVQLSIEDLLVDGSRAAVRLSVEGQDRPVFLGLSLLGDLAPWEAVDILHIADDRVVAIQPATGFPAVIEPLTRTVGVAAPTGPYRLGLIRLTLAPNAEMTDLATGGPLVLLIERGNLELHLDRPALVRQPEDEGQAAHEERTAVGAMTLSHGAELTMEADTTYDVRNTGTEPAVLLWAVLHPGADGLTNRWIRARTLDEALFAPGEAEVASQTSPPISWPPGVQSELLASGAVLEGPASSVKVALTRLTLPPHAALPSHHVLGAELLAVEAGNAEVELTAGDGAIRPRRGASLAKVSARGGFLPDDGISAGGSAILHPGASVGVRNTAEEHLVLVILSLEPESAGAMGNQSQLS